LLFYYHIFFFCVPFFLKNKQNKGPYLTYMKKKKKNRQMLSFSWTSYLIFKWSPTPYIKILHITLLSTTTKNQTF